MKQSGLGIASMILGIIGLLTSCLGVGIVFCIVGLIFAGVSMANKQAKHGMGIAGLVCSIIGIVVFIFMLLIPPADESLGVDTQDETITENESVKSEKGERKEQLSFDVGEIYNDKGCVISVTGGDERSINLEIENSSKKDYSFDVHAMSINGIMTNCNIYTGDTDVPSQKKAKMNIDIANEWLEHIDDIKYVDLIIWGYDNAESMKDFDTGIIRIKTNLFDKEESFKAGDDAQKDSGLVVYKNSIDEECVSYSIINKNDYFVETNLENCSINEWAFDPALDGYEIIVFPNSMAIVNVDVSNFVEENDIDEVKEFEFSLDVIPNEDYFEEKSTGKICFKSK